MRRKKKARDAELATKCEAYDWPSSDIAQLLPQPESTTGEIDVDSSDIFSIEVCATDSAQFNAYVKAVQEGGFDVDYNKTSDSFSAKNAEGYSVSVTRDYEDETIMDIRISAPEDKTAADSSDTSDDTTPDTNDADTSDQDATHPGTDDAQPQTPAPSETTPANGIGMDFKAAMDSYESIMNEYVDFMTKYKNDGNPVSMLADYTKMLNKYSEATQKFDAVDEGSLNQEELNYYLEVQTRVAQKLLSVQ